MGFSQEQIAAQCRISGPQLAPMPVGVDGAQLLWAISGNESSFGANIAPRHEPAFDVGGIYGANPPMPALLAEYGSGAACSYGPWQLLFCNAPAGYAPSDMSDLGKAAAATVAFLHRLLARWTPATLAGIGECWNAGHPMQNPSAGVARYVAQLTANYAVPMPPPNPSA
jgi:hypothetical protein